MKKMGGGFYIAHDMGVGKSYDIVVYVMNFDLKRTLIVAPPNVVEQWPGQFADHGDGGTVCLPLLKKPITKRTEIAKQAFNTEKKRLAIIINYEAVWREPFGKWALAQDWDMVVADELHKCKTPSSKVSKFFAKLTYKTPRRVGLSGTPIPNSPMDLWAQMRFLDPTIFGPSYVAFRSHYAIMGGYKDREVVAFKNLDELHRSFYSIAHRVKKEDVLDLPKCLDEKQDVILGPKAQKAYIEIEEEFVARIEEGEIKVSNALVELLRLQQITGGAATLETGEVVEIDKEKMRALKDTFENLPKDEPVVVFCRFVHDLEAVHRAAKEAGRKSSELSGRKKTEQEWKDGDSTILAAQIASGGIGINWMSKSCYCVFYSLGFSLAEYLQARARLDRQGQTRNVTFIHLIARLQSRQTVDARVYKALASKANVVKSILEDLT